MSTITKDMTIAEAIKLNPKAGKALQDIGMHCLGCAMAHGETVAQAAEVHGHNVDELVAAMNNAK